MSNIDKGMDTRRLFNYYLILTGIEQKLLDPAKYEKVKEFVILKQTYERKQLHDYFRNIKDVSPFFDLLMKNKWIDVFIPIGVNHADIFKKYLSPNTIEIRILKIVILDFMNETKSVKEEDYLNFTEQDYELQDSGFLKFTKYLSYRNLYMLLLKINPLLAKEIFQAAAKDYLVFRNEEEVKINTCSIDSIPSLYDSIKTVYGKRRLIHELWSKLKPNVSETKIFYSMFSDEQTQKTLLFLLDQVMSDNITILIKDLCDLLIALLSSGDRSASEMINFADSVKDILNKYDYRSKEISILKEIIG